MPTTHNYFSTYDQRTALLQREIVVLGCGRERSGAENISTERMDQGFSYQDSTHGQII